MTHLSKLFLITTKGDLKTCLLFLLQMFYHGLNIIWFEQNSIQYPFYDLLLSDFSYFVRKLIFFAMYGYLLGVRPENDWYPNIFLN